MPTTISSFIEKSVEAERPSQLFNLFGDYLDAFDIDVASYHQVREKFEEFDFEESLKFENFPDQWINHYETSNYYDIDPIIQASKTIAKPFHWFEIEKLMPLTDQQTHFLQELKQTGLQDGLAVPVFGPGGSVAYFGLGAWDDDIVLTDARASELHFACHQVHLRFCEITENDEEDAINLSPREREVMQWVAKGKSNTVISDILGVSEHTVDTILRRVFKKMGVNTRITAAVKAIGLGVINA